jgi:hypothetical protein
LSARIIGIYHHAQQKKDNVLIKKNETTPTPIALCHEEAQVVFKNYFVKNLVGLHVLDRKHDF